MADLMGGMGVDAGIPLRAAPPTANPLETIGKFVGVQNAMTQGQILQQILPQQRQKTLNEQRSSAYGLLAPMMALPPDQWTHQTVTDLLARGEHNGYITQPILADLAAGPQADGAALAGHLRPFIASQMQTGASERLGAVVPATHFLPVGDQTLPLTIAPAGALTPGVPTQSAPGFGQGYTPGERLPTLTRKATQADVDRDPRITVGQDIPIPATEVVKPYSNPHGGARIPIGGLGPGGYAPPQKPLTQLGPAYRAPGAAAPVAQPAAAPPVPGARLMKGPGGSFWVTPDKVPTFQQNGYQ